jgi:FAD/FMN-containing dehydrogenase/Fe-S oxidoreductase
MNLPFLTLKEKLQGEFYFGETGTDQAIRKVYATDASMYQEKPVAVAIPKTVDDIRTLIHFANDNKLTLIPRAAGTSLAGQVVGSGLIVDISKNLNRVLEVNAAEKWVRVQPGVIRDDLNVFMKPYGLMFGPETSTSNRAMIGGMIGNNSCGLHSIIWGSTRENLLEVKALLSDGNEVVFKALNKEELTQKYSGRNCVNELEQAIYLSLRDLLQNEENQTTIEEGFPKKNITRRNTGYALDTLSVGFIDNLSPVNICKLIAGSEGTLCFITEAKLKLIDLPPKEIAIIAVHCSSIKEALLVNLIALKHHCSASELVDAYILEFTKTNIEQSKNRFFVEGDPRAILMVEFQSQEHSDIVEKANDLISDLREESLGYAYPILYGEDTINAWDLRKSGLGLIRNIRGNEQPVNLIEDFAVDPADLPAYIEELQQLLQKHELKYSMYAHAGAGELHVEPMVNLKTTVGKLLLKQVLSEAATLVKKYKGSLSGEHGDGRLRGEFIPFMMGENNYQLFKKVKQIFDPKGIFNKGKITDTPVMNEFLRYEQDKPAITIKTIFDFSDQEGILRLTEKCSGSGDCRKSHISGGTMCPSYMATLSEKDTTRARANILRQYFTNNLSGIGEEEAKEVLDLCLSCKACKSECPSSVDMSKLKAEFLQHYYDKHGVSFRTQLIGNFTKQMKLASLFPWGYNLLAGTKSTRRLMNRMIGFHPDRSLPLLAPSTLQQVLKRKKDIISNTKGLVYLFCDEFTNYNDVEVGRKTVDLLNQLGYQVIIPPHFESGRPYLSKGLLWEAQKIAIKNVEALKDIITSETPLIGIEPSAILCIREEYLSLVPVDQRAAANRLAKNTFTFEEWIAREMDKNNITSESFVLDKRQVQLHGHCQQKALTSIDISRRVLSLPQNYEVHIIPSGCCGMAGSFGFEKEHYQLSMKIGELVLFPAVRKQADDVIICASGTSCRHQIKDGTGRIALHAAEVLWEALKE